MAKQSSAGESDMTLAYPGTFLQEFLRSRRSVRRFTKEPVPRPVLEQILETATWAPNPHNRQPWRFVVLSTPDAKYRLADAMGNDFRRALAAEGLAPEAIAAQVDRSRRRIVEAPVAVLLCADPDVMDVYADPNRLAGERQMALQSVALAGGTLLLAAHAEGLGAVWLCAPLFVPAAVREALELPASWEAQALILLGHPAHVPEPRPRLPLSKVARFI